MNPVAPKPSYIVDTSSLLHKSNSVEVIAKLNALAARHQTASPKITIDDAPSPSPSLKTGGPDTPISVLPPPPPPTPVNANHYPGLSVSSLIESLSSQSLEDSTSAA